MTNRSRSEAIAVLAATLLMMVCLTTAASAQALGDVAKKEAERRQHASAGKRYSIADLLTDTGSGMPVAPEAAPSAPEPPKVSTQEAAAPPPKERRDESYWRERATEIRTKREQLHGLVKVLQTRVESLGEDLKKGAGSPALSERDVSLRALAGAQKDAQSMLGEWERFDARARAMNVPPAWIR
jgi:hypothetical protein